MNIQKQFLAQFCSQGQIKQKEQTQSNLLGYWLSIVYTNAFSILTSIAPSVAAPFVFLKCTNL